MKKLYILFAVVFSFVASTNAWAQYRQGDEPLVTITAGQKVLIQNGREADMATSYLKWSATSGNVITDYLTDKIDDTSVMEFVDAGSGKFYLYNPANEAYVESVDQAFSGDFKLHWTTDITKAAPLTVSDEILAADISTPALMFYQELSLYNIPTWYLTAASPFAQSAAGFSYILNEGYEYYYAWVVYEAVSDGGKSYLESVFDTYFPAGFNDEIWSIGNASGCITQEVFSTLQSAYNTALSAYEAGDKDAETYTQLADALLAAYNTAVSSIQPIVPGYYFIRNFAMDAYVYAREDNDGSNNFTRAYWTNNEIPETYESDIAPYIWKVEASETGSDYMFYNPYFEKYITRSGSYGLAVPLMPASEQTGTFGIAYQGESYAQQGGYFNVTNTYFGGRILRAIGNGVGYSSNTRDPKEDDALWQFVPVPESFVTAMEAEKLAGSILTRLSALVDASNALYAKTKVYDTPMTINGTLDTPGLIENLTTNAQEVTEGDAVYAIDSDVNTFFHTSWSDESEKPEGFHCMDVSLSEPVQDIAIKILKRINAEMTGPVSKHNPLIFTVYTLSGGVADSVGTYKAVYDQGLKLYEESTDLVENMVSVTYLSLPVAASELRIEVRATEANAEGHPYFCLSEIGVFKATYDAAKSPYENIPVNVRDAFVKALADAEAQLADGVATQEVLDALQEAYEAMNDAFADRSELRKLLDEARTYEYEAIEDDELLGYYASGSVEVFKNALDRIEARIDQLTNPTTEEFAQVKESIDAAMSAFDAALNKPDASMLYFIQSASASGDNYECYLNTTSNDVTFASLSKAGVENPGGYLNYMWRIEPLRNGTFLVRNAASGMYLGGIDRSTGYVTSTYDNTPLSIVSARTPGALSLQTANGDKLFALDFQQGVVLRTETQGSDGAAFTFVSADFQGTHTMSLYETMQVVTLPFAILAQMEGATAYSIAGRTTVDDAVTAQLAAYATTDVIPAATPFIIVAEEGTTEVTFYTAEGTDGTAIEYVLTPGTAMGLVGTLQSQIVRSPYGVLRSGKVDAALRAGQTILANSGYFDFSTMEETTITGDIQLSITDAVSAIPHISLQPSTDASVYDLQGRRVQHMRQGGIYIVGGRKVIVK